MKTEIIQDAEYDDVMQEAEKVNGVNFIISNKITKSDIPALSDLLVRNILNNGNPLAAAENIKKMKLILEGVESDKRYSAYVLEEVSKYGKCYTSPTGVKIEPFEAGTKYYYDKCNDKVIADLLIQKQDLDEKIKQREKFLKALPKEGLEQVDRETGEVFVLYPPYKTSVSTIKITLSK